MKYINNLSKAFTTDKKTKDMSKVLIRAVNNK
jgi:hypothetical protein